MTTDFDFFRNKCEQEWGNNPRATYEKLLDEIAELEAKLNRIYKIADSDNPSIDLIWQIAKQEIDK